MPPISLKNRVILHLHSVNPTHTYNAVLCCGDVWFFDFFVLNLTCDLVIINYSISFESSYLLHISLFGYYSFIKMKFVLFFTLPSSSSFANHVYNTMVFLHTVCHIFDMFFDRNENKSTLKCINIYIDKIVASTSCVRIQRIVYIFFFLFSTFMSWS